MDSIEQYRHLFIPHGSIPRILNKQSDSWEYLNNHRGLFTNSIISNHLKEQNIYGQELANSKIAMFVLDFDFNENDTFSEDEFWNKIRFCKNRILAPSIFFQSSKSRGVHAYFYISPTDAAIVRERVFKSLTYGGIKVQPGLVEILTKGVIRLPLGKDSFLLDPETFQKATQNKEEIISKLYQQIYHKRVNNIYDAVPLPKLKVNKYIKISQRTTINPRVNKYLSVGLTDSGQTNEALLTMCSYFYYHTSGNIHDTRTYTKNWFLEKHNNHSNDYNNGGMLFLDRKITYILRSLEKYKLKYDDKPLLNKLNSTTLGAWAFEYVYTSFKNYKYTLQVKIIALIKYIVILSAGNSSFKLSKSDMIKELGFSSSNYLHVLEQLKTDGLLELISRGNNLKQHASRYKWHGQFKDEKEYDEYAHFIIDTNKLMCYSKYYRRIITKNYRLED